ncbi:hypothetical protein FRC04_012089 [Tulasnella sp. 424]|nr:hypothetical protein FRC04_012089 [Tulasnella sp. 424]
MIEPNAIEDIVKDYAGLIMPKSFTVPINQSRIINDILKSEHLSRYPPSKSFQLQFLKSVISHLEHINEEVDDSIYERYLELLAAQSASLGIRYDAFRLRPSLEDHPQNGIYAGVADDYHALRIQNYYRGGNYGPPYLASSFRVGKLAFTISRSAAGVKGWKTMNLDTPSSGILEAKTVLELGSGTGFLGILAAQLQSQGAGSQAAIVLTDCNAEVLERCRLNSTEDPADNLANHPSITIRPLDWSDCLADSSERNTLFHYFCELSADVIIGTDLVFDPSIIPALVATLRLALEGSASSGLKRQTEALLAVAIRRETTFAEFKTACMKETAGLSVEEESLDENGCGPFIGSISRSTSLNDHVGLFRIRLFGTSAAQSGATNT